MSPETTPCPAQCDAGTQHEVRPYTRPAPGLDGRLEGVEYEIVTEAVTRRCCRCGGRGTLLGGVLIIERPEAS
jgi:hypothetical protein